MTFVQKKDVRRMLGEHAGIFRILLLAYLVSSVAGLLTSYMLNPRKAEALFGSFVNQSTFETDAWPIKVLEILLRNALISFAIIGCGIASRHLPIIVVSLNGFALSFMAMQVAIKHDISFIYVLLSALPILVCELPALALSAILGIRANILITEHEYISSVDSETMRRCLRYIISALIIGAAIEATMLAFL